MHHVFLFSLIFDFRWSRSSISVLHALCFWIFVRLNRLRSDTVMHDYIYFLRARANNGPHAVIVQGVCVCMHHVCKCACAGGGHGR